MTWRSARGAWIEGGRGDLFKGLGVMVLLNQMESFLDDPVVTRLNTLRQLYDLQGRVNLS